MESTSFRDAEGKEWILCISTQHARQMLTEVKVDLDQVADGKVFSDLALSRMKLGASLWIICAKQAERDNITPEQFAERLNSDCIQDACDALEVAILNFIPPQARKIAQTVIDQQKRGREKSTEAIEIWATENQEKLDEEIEKQVTETLQRKVFGKR